MSTFSWGPSPRDQGPEYSTKFLKGRNHVLFIFAISVSSSGPRIHLVTILYLKAKFTIRAFRKAAMATESNVKKNASIRTEPAHALHQVMCCDKKIQSIRGTHICFDLEIRLTPSFKAPTKGLPYSTNYFRYPTQETSSDPCKELKSYN